MSCSNCDGRKCMSCIFREPDHECMDDCPECCGTPLFDLDDDYDYDFTLGGDLYE